MKKTRRPSPGEPLSRRVFIHRLTFFGGGVVLLGAGCKKEAPSPPPRKGGLRPKGLTTAHRTFTSEEFKVMSAACERVLPRDEDAGALDANVPEYIDRMLTSPDLTHMREDFVGGVNALDRRARGLLGVGFAAATPAQQDELLRIFKDSPGHTGEARFYELLLVLTLEGFLGDPSYGGNREGVGWALVGFDVVSHHLHHPPGGH